MSVGPDGQFHKGLQLFTVERGRFVPLAEARQFNEQIEEVAEPPAEEAAPPETTDEDTQQPVENKRTTLKIRPLRPDEHPQAPAATIAH